MSFLSFAISDILDESTGQFRRVTEYILNPVTGELEEQEV